MSFGEHVIHLNDGREMPLLGLGVYKATEDEELKQAISSAVSWGYRLIDTASFYKNEEGVGKGIQALDIPREDLFVTTKIWNTAQRIGDIEDSFNRSLERLGLDYVDLYLIHWPVPGCFGNTWKAMEKLREEGKVKSIGVSNFSIQDLELLKTVSDVVPAVNQVECNPFFQQRELRALLEKDAVIIGTGRRKDGSFMASMYDEGQAIRLPFPHHSSRKDARFLSESNCFQTVLPFHSNVKEVWNG